MLLWLFMINFYISAFTFGGGYIVIKMIQRFFVEEKQLFSMEELMEMSAVAQSSPGAIAINLSMLAGYRTAGKKGAMISVIASILPPFFIMCGLSLCYVFIKEQWILQSILKAMQAGVAAIFIDMLLDLGKNVMEEQSVLIKLMFPCVFAACFFFSVSVFYLLLLCIFISILDAWRLSWKIC